MPGAALRLDLGCGRVKAAGFVGLDRFPMPGVDVVADLDRGSLPFADDSFDLILAFHSLEHVADLQSTMREVWRVGRPGAQVCIGAPYWAQGLNVANPYHKQVFNEHTPRFWTCAPTAPVDPAEFVRPPQGAMWGLAASDNSRPDFDLRTLRIEMFYFAEYWPLPPEERIRLRRQRFDVCEHILDHLAVMKPPLTDAALGALSLDLYDPPVLAERRRMAAAGAAPDAMASVPRAGGWRERLRGLIRR
jgi:SAM-dependent methyltransferase